MPAVAEQLELERTVLSLTFSKVSDKKQAMFWIQVYKSTGKKSSKALPIELVLITRINRSI